MAYTIKIECPKCHSGDCNSTLEPIGELIRSHVAKSIIYCNHCTYHRVNLLVNQKVLVIESKEPGSDDTEIEYMYLGRMPG